MIAFAAAMAPLCTAHTAMADDLQAAPPASVPPPSHVESTPIERSYWWQTAAFDGAALGISLAGLGTSETGTFVPVAVGTYLLGAPAVHLGHGSIGRALGSFGLRVGAPTLSTIIGAGIGSMQTETLGHDSCCSAAVVGGFYGLLVGTGVASILDAAFLAREKVDAPRSSDSGFVKAWSPTIGISPQHATIGVQGLLF